MQTITFSPLNRTTEVQNGDYLLKPSMRPNLPPRTPPRTDLTSSTRSPAPPVPMRSPAPPVPPRTPLTPLDNREEVLKLPTTTALHNLLKLQLDPGSLIPSDKENRGKPLSKSSPAPQSLPTTPLQKRANLTASAPLPPSLKNGPKPPCMSLKKPPPPSPRMDLTASTGDVSASTPTTPVTSRLHSKSSPTPPTFLNYTSRPRSLSEPHIDIGKLRPKVEDRTNHKVTATVMDPEVRFSEIVYKVEVSFNNTNWTIYRDYKEFKKLFKHLSSLLSKYNLLPHTNSRDYFVKISKDVKKDNMLMLGFCANQRADINSFIMESCRVMNQILSLDKYKKEKAKFFTFIGPYHKNNSKRLTNHMLPYEIQIPHEVIESYVQCKSSKELQKEDFSKKDPENLKPKEKEAEEMHISVEGTEVKFDRLLYKVVVTYKGVTWTIFRRWNQFISINARVHHHLLSHQKVSLKKLSNKEKRSEEYFQSRMGDLNTFMKGCCENLNSISKKEKDRIEFFKFIGPYCYGDMKRYSVAIPLVIF